MSGYPPDDEPNDYGIRAGEEYDADCPGLVRPTADELRRRDRTQRLAQQTADSEDAAPSWD